MRHDQVAPMLAGPFLSTARSRWLLVFAFVITALGQAASAAELEPLAARIRELREALPPDVKLADEEDLAGIATLVEKLFGPQGVCAGDANWLSGLFKSGTRAKDLTPHLDLERMFGSLEADAGGQPDPARAALRQQVQQPFLDRAAKLPLLTGITNCRVRRLHLDQHEAELYTSQQQARGERVDGHYWLCQREGAWRIRELEDTRMGARLVASHISEYSLAGKARQKRKDIERSLLEYRAKRDMDLGGDVQPLLDELEKETLDPELQMQRLIVQGKEHRSNDHVDDALVALAKAEALRPGTAVVRYERAMCFSRREKYPEALAELRLHQQIAGPNLLVIGELAQVLFALHDLPGALTAYRQGLAEDPANFEYLFEILGIKPDLPRSELDEYLAKLPLRQAEFEALANDIYNKKAWTALEALIARYREVAPKSHLHDYMEAQMFLARDQYEQAAELFKAGMAKHKYIPGFQGGYLNCMLELNRGLEGYREATNPREAFIYLAASSEDIGNYRRGLLGKLIVAHRERFPDDPALFYYEARLKTMDKDYLGAAELMRQGMKHFTWSYRCEVEYRALMTLAGQSPEAFEKSTQQEDVFEELAMRYYDNSETDKLAKLLELRTKSHPNDQRLTAFRARLLLLQDKPQKAADLLRPLLNGQTEHYEQELFLEAMLACDKPVEAYLESPWRAHSFSYLVMRVADNDDLEKLLNAARAREPNHPDITYYHALLLIGRDQEAQAVTFLRGAMAGATKDELERLQPLYLQTAEELYGIMVAYGGAPDAEAAFRSLASTCYFTDEFDALEKLIAAHRQRAPKDHAVVGMYVARTHAHFKRYDRAIAAYDAVTDGTAGHEISYHCRKERFDLMVKAGKAVELFERLSPDVDNFTQVARACRDLPDADQLAALLAVRRKQVADPQQLLEWEAKLLELRQDYEGLVKLMTRSTLLGRSDTENEYLVRALIRLKRFDEAAPIADRLDHNVPYFTALVAGSRGDVPVATRALEECLKYGDYDLAAFGADDLLGPLLNTPPFEEFWKKQKAIEDAASGDE